MPAGLPDSYNRLEGGRAEQHIGYPEDAMKTLSCSVISEELIRRRSYAIWESEGRLEGRSEEYWLRALAELREEMERSWQAALSPEAPTDIVMPHPAISQPPKRHVSGRINPGHRQAA